jgi:hypothetical protein
MQYTERRSIYSSTDQEEDMLRIPAIALLTLALLLPGMALAHNQLNAAELEKRFSNTTQLCRKEGDQSLCTTYFSADGEIKRRMHADDKRRDGTWKVDPEKNELCITWKGRTRALCFEAFDNKDGTVDMYKHGKHISTVLSFETGNTEGL